MSDLRVRLILDSENNASGGVRELRNDARDLDSQMGLLEQRFNQFIAFKVGEVALQWAGSLIKTADTYETLEAKLARVTDSYSEQMTVQKALFDISQDARVNLTLAEDTYIKNADAIKRMGGNTQQALQVTETLAKAIASTSQGVQQDTAALNQWSQALGKGVLNGDELNSIMENSLGLSQAIADGMGIPIGKLKELGEQGKLTGVDLVNALIDQKEHIDEIFKSVPITVEQGVTTMFNAWTRYIGETDKALGVTDAIAHGLVRLSGNIPEVVQGTLLLAGIYGVQLTQRLGDYIAATLNATAAQRASAAAAEHEALAQVELLRVKVLATEASTVAARTMWEEARVHAAVAARIDPLIVSEQRLSAALVGQADAAALAAREQVLAAELRVRAAMRAAAADSADAVAAEQLALALQELEAAQLSAAETAAVLAEAEERAALAQEAVVIAQEAVIAASVEAAAAQEALAAAAAALTAAETAAAEAMKLYTAALYPVEAESIAAARGVGILTTALNGLILGWIAWEGLGWLGKHFEAIRFLVLDTERDVEGLGTVLKHVLKGQFLDDSGPTLASKLDEIDKKYQKMIAASTDAAKEEAERSQKTKEFLEQEKIARAENFKEQQTQLKESTTLVDAEYTRQTAIIKQALEARKTDIIAEGLTEVEKEQAITQAVNQATAERLAAMQQAGAAKLQLLDQVYAKELAKLKEGTVEQKAVEKQSIQERIAVYSALERNYSAIIDEMIGDEQRHAQAVEQLLNSRAVLERDTEETIRHIRQGGLSDEEKLTDQKKELEGYLSQQRRALAEGDIENARHYGEEAAKLAAQLASQAEAAYKAGQGYSSDAEGFIKKFRQAREAIGQAMDKEAEAHTQQQQRLAGSIKDAQLQLDTTRSKIDGLSKELQNKHVLKIDADTKAVDAAISRIEQPTSSVHTIHVVEDTSGSTNWSDGQTRRVIKREGNSYSYDYKSVDAPQGLQDGGFPRVAGLLPGYGGGDQIPAMLERGEFVLNKEAVSRNGSAAIEALNRGDVRVHNVLKLSTGGGVGLWTGLDTDSLLEEKRVEMIKSGANAIFANFGIYGSSHQLARLGATPQELQRVDYILGLYKDAAKGRGNFFTNHKKMLADQLAEHVTDKSDKVQKVLASSGRFSGTELDNGSWKKIDLQPNYPNLQPNLPNVDAVPSTKLVSSTASNRTATVKFEFPNQKQPIVGQFAADDVDTLLSHLSDAASRAALPRGGHY